MSSFDFVRPKTLEEAGDALLRDGARALAGGTDLIPQLREGRRAASRLVDLKRVVETSEISLAEDGALTMEVLCGVFASMETGGWVDLPLKEEIVPPGFKKGK